MEVRSWLSEPAVIARAGRKAAADGAKVLVIRNTVANAQAVFNELVGQAGGEWALTVNGTPTLHHSRFAAEDRKLLDDAVEAVLGKERTPGGRIVIGTQTLEQSLDIDADILITDLCPVDVLLQRIGRLHRHTRDRTGNFAPIWTRLCARGSAKMGRVSNSPRMLRGRSVRRCRRSICLRTCSAALSRCRRETRSKTRGSRLPWAAGCCRLVHTCLSMIGRESDEQRPTRILERA